MALISVGPRLEMLRSGPEIFKFGLDQSFLGGNKERSPDDEWELLEYWDRTASPKRKSMYAIKGIKCIWPCYSEGTYKKFLGLQTSHPLITHHSYSIFWETISIKPERPVKDVETCWNSIYLIRPVYLKETTDMWVRSRTIMTPLFSILKSGIILTLWFTF